MSTTSNHGCCNCSFLLPLLQVEQHGLSSRWFELAANAAWMLLAVLLVYKHLDESDSESWLVEEKINVNKCESAWRCLSLLLQDLLLLSSRHECLSVISCYSTNDHPVSPPPLLLSLSQDTECWERSVLRVAEITSALIRERSPALVGQLLQAWREAAARENPLSVTHQHSRDETLTARLERHSRN